MRTSRAIYGALLAVVAAGAHAEDCGQLTTMRLPHVTVTAAEQVLAANAAPDAAASKPAGDAKPAATAAKSAAGAARGYCRVRATSKPTADSDIRFEVWIPFGDAWNGKFEQVGNGGFAGAIPERAMAHALSLGFAVAGTDDGHQSADMTDARWALGHEEKVEDYGWRAIDETTRAAKLIVRALKSKAPAKSYFVGCSDGGREALMMAERFPTYFDGIVAGAPAYAMSRLLTSGAVHSAELTTAAGHLSSAKLELLQSSVLKSCGHGARYLKDPRQCHPDLAALKCTAGDADTCLTEAQIATARAIYSEAKDPSTGGTLYAVLPGAEGLKGSWDAWLVGTDDGGKPAALGFTWNYLANMVMHNPRLDLAKVTAEDIVRGERHYAPLMDAADPDLHRFKAHGGKLIQYHGWNDPAIPPGYSLEYRARLLTAMGTVDDFYRLYMVPGMLHCGGGDAPTNIDWHAAIMAWVEKGTAPTVLTAADARGDTQAVRPFAPDDVTAAGASP